MKRPLKTKRVRLTRLSRRDQKLIDEFYQAILNLTEKEATALKEAHQIMMESQREYEAKQAKRLELLRVLIVIKKSKIEIEIEIEKRVLQEQIDKLNSL